MTRSRHLHGARRQTTEVFRKVKNMAYV